MNNVKFLGYVSGVLLAISLGLFTNVQAADGASKRTEAVQHRTIEMGQRITCSTEPDVNSLAKRRSANVLCHVLDDVYSRATRTMVLPAGTMFIGSYQAGVYYWDAVITSSEAFHIRDVARTTIRSTEFKTIRGGEESASFVELYMAKDLELPSKPDMHGAATAAH